MSSALAVRKVVLLHSLRLKFWKQSMHHKCQVKSSHSAAPWLLFRSVAGCPLGRITSAPDERFNHGMHGCFVSGVVGNMRLGKLLTSQNQPALRAIPSSLLLRRENTASTYHSGCVLSHFPLNQRNRPCVFSEGILPRSKSSNYSTFRLLKTRLYELFALENWDSNTFRSCTARTKELCVVLFLC